MKNFHVVILCLATVAVTRGDSKEQTGIDPSADVKGEVTSVEGKTLYGPGLGVRVPFGAPLVGVTPLGLGGVGGGVNKGGYGGFAGGQHAAGATHGASGFGYNHGGSNAKVFSDKQTFGSRETFSYSNNAGHAVGSGHRAQGGVYNQGGYSQGGLSSAHGYGAPLVG